MSTIEETTPLLLPGPFFLPVIYPAKLGAVPQLYYDDLANHGVAVTVVPTSPTGPFQITVDGIGYTETRTRKRRKKETTVTIRGEDVYALTAGFASYEQQKLVLRLWAGDVDNLVKSAGVRPNRIVYGSLDLDSIKSSFTTCIGELPKAVLQESWTQEKGGKAPEDDATLQQALLDRFIAGDARIYVEAGAVLGTGNQMGDSMTLTVECFFDPDDPAHPQAPTVPVPTEDVIDNALEPGRIIRYAGHPLVKAAGEVAINVHFLSQFEIYNNATYDYEPFALREVTLLATPPVPLLPDDLVPKIPVVSVVTDSLGRVDFVAPLPSRASIRFRYDTTSPAAGTPFTVGKRTFDADIETDHHKARAYVNPALANEHTYRAKYQVYPLYQAFIDDIVAQGSQEVIEQDRGSTNEFDQSKPTELLSLATLVEVLEVMLPDRLEPRIAFSQHDLQAQIAGCEAFYRQDLIPSSGDTFNLLVEGDSWTNYPLAYNDLYSHLDEIFQRKLKAGKSYNRIPLQHFGDRADQMFVTVPGVKRQFDFTRDFLDEYPVDLIFCSAGGNDFAEPGISADFDVEPFKSYIVNGYFDPYAAEPHLTATEIAQAKALMSISFAALLKNHPWNLYLSGAPASQQKDEPTMRAELDGLVAALIAQAGADFGPTPEQAALLDHKEVLQEIGDKVIARFPDDPPPGSPAAQLLDAVFDTVATTARYAAIEQRWLILLGEAAARGIPVISHAYGYPLFSELQTSYLGLGKEHITGPWFTHRFAQANVTDRRVQKMCLKAFLDHITLKVFEQFKADYDFDFVDTRNENSLVERWRDELHLRSTGYKKNAEKVFAKVCERPALADYFDV
jgi:hypothetical protein